MQSIIDSIRAEGLLNAIQTDPKGNVLNGHRRFEAIRQFRHHAPDDCEDDEHLRKRRKPRHRRLDDEWRPEW